MMMIGDRSAPNAALMQLMLNASLLVVQFFSLSPFYTCSSISDPWQSMWWKLFLGTVRAERVSYDLIDVVSQIFMAKIMPQKRKPLQAGVENPSHCGKMTKPLQDAVKRGSSVNLLFGYTSISSRSWFVGLMHGAAPYRDVNMGAKNEVSRVLLPRLSCDLECISLDSPPTISLQNPFNPIHLPEDKPTEVHHHLMKMP